MACGLDLGGPSHRRRVASHRSITTVAVFDAERTVNMGIAQEDADVLVLEHPEPPLIASSSRRVPPPLPPRGPKPSADDAPPPYTLEDENEGMKQDENEGKQEGLGMGDWGKESRKDLSKMPTPRHLSNDQRSSSMQSLLPDSRGGRRTLLLIFIHGFMGNETSFQNFPAHLHSLLTMTLAESHVVHTKIYPRYKSKKAIEFARDDLSNWYAHSPLLFLHI